MDYLRGLVCEEGIASDSSSNSGGEAAAYGLGQRLLNEDQDEDYSDGEENGEWVTLTLPPDFVETLVDYYGPQPGVDLMAMAGSKEDRTILIPPTLEFAIYRLLYMGADVEEKHQERSPSEEAQKDENSNPEDLAEILKLIAALEDDETGHVLAELDNDEEFKTILENERALAQKELIKYEELKSIRWTMAQKVKCFQLRGVFPTLNQKTVEDVFLQNELDYEKALGSLKDIYPSRYRERVEKAEVQPVTRARSASGSDFYYDPDVVACLTPMEKSALLEQAANWRRDADHFSKKFHEAKQHAENHKSLKPAHAFKTLEATEIRQHAQQALEKYWFFTLMALNAGNKNPNKIDLHGLSVNKAREIVARYMLNRKTWALNHLPRNSSITLTIITGHGRHSLHNIPKLFPAVRQLLLDHRYSFSEGENVGSFFVTLTNKGDNIDRPKKSIKKLSEHARTK